MGLNLNVSNTDMLFRMDDTQEHEAGLVMWDENKDVIREYVNQEGINDIADVTAAFVKLVEKEDNNGAVLTVQKTVGMKYRFLKHPIRL